MHRPPPGADPCSPLTLDRLRQAGRPLSLVRRREYLKVFRGVWVHRDGLDADTRARAALALHPAGAWISRTSAAQLFDLPVPSQAFVHVTVAEAEHRRQRAGIKSHVTQRPRTLWSVRGMAVTDPFTTFVECAGMLSLVDLVVLGDAILRRWSLPPERLQGHCRTSDDYYAGLARAGAELVRAGVDSPQESRLRLLLVLGGLPEPAVDHRVHDSSGRLLRRYDLYYEAARLLVEYDGRQHAEDVGQWESDIERREELDDQRQRLIVVTAKGIYSEPGRTLARVRRALLAAGCPVPPASDRWREHFPPR